MLSFELQIVSFTILYCISTIIEDKQHKAKLAEELQAEEAAHAIIVDTDDVNEPESDEPVAAENTLDSELLPEDTIPTDESFAE